MSQRLNSYNGSGEFSSRKPWSINRYGLFVGQGISSNYAPDNWAQLGANRYQWMWGTYTTELQYPDWNNRNFNAAGLQGLRYFVRQYIRSPLPASQGLGAPQQCQPWTPQFFHGP